MVKSRAVWDEIYVNWYNRSIGGVYQINSKGMLRALQQADASL